MAMNETGTAVVLTETASATVASRNVRILGVVAAAAATTCSVLLYDPPRGTTTTTGATLRLALNSVAADSQVYHSDGGIQFLNGCVAVVAGTGALATVIYGPL